MLKLTKDIIVENKLDKDDSVIYFENDEEFYQFCVAPVLKSQEYKRKDGTVGYFADFDFTQGYKDAVKAGKRFVIKDEDSQIFKHGSVSYRTITKNVQNLDQYFGED